MAKGRIDPAFQAAPFYGESSYDPIRAVQQLKEQEYSRNLLKYKKQQEDMEKGLKDINLEIKSWEDQKGFEEISTELENLRAKYVELGNEGYNLTRPTDLSEQKLSKAFHTAVNDLKHKHDVWQAQKQRIDAAQKVIDTQLQKPEEERDIDTEAVYANMKQLKDTDGVLNRDDITSQLLVNKSRPADVGQYVLSNFSKAVPGMDKWVKSWSWDPATNKFSKVTGEGIKPARLLSGMSKLLASAPQNVKNAVEKEYREAKAANPQMLETKEEWFAKRYSPETPVREERTMTGGGSGTGGGFGLPQKDETGNYPLQPQVREMHFGTKDPGVTNKVYPYESVGRVPIGATFGFKPISVVGSANNINTITGTVEAKGLTVPATPIELNMMPIAQDDIIIEVFDPKAQKVLRETIAKGERIPKHILDQVRTNNQVARDNGKVPPHKVGYEPFVTLGLNYKQKKERKEGEAAPEGAETLESMVNIYMDQSGRTMSYTETSIVPYDEVKKDLFAGAAENKQDWKPFDDYIQSLYNQLNGTDRINSLFEVKGKTVEELSRALED